jgi:hypothetical protein
LSLHIEQEPFELPVDDRKRARWAFNISALLYPTPTP